MLFGDLGGVAHAVHRARRHIDEAAHTGGPAGLYQRLEAIIVDGPAQFRVKLETGIVGDARHMYDAVDAHQALSVVLSIADVAFGHFEIRVR